MTTTLKEQAWQSGLVLLQDEKWNSEDWPPLAGGWRFHHALVVLDHPNPDHHSNNNNNNKRQTVVVLGGADEAYNTTNSVCLLNLEDGPNQQWRDGPPMNTKREGHAAVVCNGGLYVVGGYRGDLNCVERMEVTDLLQDEPSLTFSSSSTTQESCWTRWTCRLSEERWGCCAVAVHNRYIVVMGGRSNCYLSSVDILDTSSNHTVTAGPSMTVPRACCASAIIGHRIFVVGGCNDEDGMLDSVEYLDYATPCDSDDDDEPRKETGSTFLSVSPTWTTHSELRLVNVQSLFASSCAMVAVGLCLVVATGSRPTVQVLDMHRNHHHVWNLSRFGDRDGCTLVTVANHIAVIGGWYKSSCATLPLMDRNSWCFGRLQSNEWYPSLNGGSMGTIRDADISHPCCPAWKRARPNPCQTDDGGKDET